MTKEDAVAIRAWNVGEPERAPGPDLRLVTAGSRRPRAVPAVLFVLLLAGLIGLPVVRASLAPAPEFPAFRGRPLPAASIPAIDRITAAPRGSRPRSPDPAGGILFVRCTHLWAALPDGSHAHKILEMPAISAPAFSPDGRTIAFLADGPGGQELWLAAADGSRTKKLGALRLSGGPLPARATALAWSPNSHDLAFAITDTYYGPWTGGSAIWVLDLNRGKFERVASGWPAPLWAGRRLAYAVMGEGGTYFTTPSDSARVRGTLSSKGAVEDLSAARALSDWRGNYRNGTAVIRRHPGGRLEIAIHDTYSNHDEMVVRPPRGYEVVEYGQPSIAQDGSRVLVDLVDEHGERDLGLLRTATGEWTVLDYAWDPVATPAPTVDGPPAAARALRAVEDLILNWNGRKGAMLAGGPDYRALLPMSYPTPIAGPPVRADSGWDVPIVAYDTSHRRVFYRQLIVRVRGERGRLTASPEATSELAPVVTVEDAHDFVEVALGRSVPIPTYMPTGARLARWPIEGWTVGGVTTASIRFVIPRTEDHRRKFLTASYGRDIDFSLGCGETPEPEPTTVAGVPALVGKSGRTRQVIWPATMEERTGPYAVYGEVTEAELLRVANSMQYQLP